MNFSFLRQETTKLGRPKIMVKISHVNWPPLLAVLTTVEDHDVAYGRTYAGWAVV